MVMVMAYENAKSRQFRVEGDGIDLHGGVSTTPFFGSLDRADRGKRDIPQAFLSQADKGRTSRAHFHALDQFQILIDGGVKIGRHEMTPCSVHFARAYTPYGPLEADAGCGMTQIVLRPFHDPMGPLRIPDKQSVLESVPDRRPWQVYASSVAFAELNVSGVAAEFALEAISGLNVNGLTAHTLSMDANAVTCAPDPATANGQYVIVLKGSLMQDDKAHAAVTMVYVSPHEVAYRIHAGPQGLQALILGFPPLRAPSSAGAGHAIATGGEVWRCLMCAFVYESAAGLVAESIAPGTRWRSISDVWTCPNCSSPKSLFSKI